MILATILRNFKCYKGINIIPLSCDRDNCLNMIIGNNGVGKSAILEGLDTLFNNAPWIINNDTRKRDDTEVGAFFLIDKCLIDSILDTSEKAIVEEVSNFFWHVDLESNAVLKQFEPLKAVRDNILIDADKKYLLLIARGEKGKSLGFMSFITFVRNALSSRPTNETLSKILEKILAIHSYIYIPVETPVSDFVRLQNNSLQVLMDKSIKGQIANALNSRRINRRKGRGTLAISVLQIINEELEAYVSSVETEIQKESPGYSYKPAPRQSTKLTANHVTDVIIEAYYSKRIFKKDDKAIDTLSSGEKRVILIDIISAFIRNNDPNRELIVAIDEPESSLHVSHCYKQFSKINKIALQFRHQLLVTTHWYGALPCLDRGGLIHIADDGTPNIYELSNYFEERRRLPEDINLKGFFDLASSLLYSYRNNDETMILVEGSEDKRYIEYYLGTERATIIPLGGCSIVKKIFEYLYTPMNDQEMVDVTKTKKIICLVDTDVTCTSVNVASKMKSGSLRLVRLHQERNEDANLLYNDDPNKSPTEVENVLEPKLFYNAIVDCINSSDDIEIKSIIADYAFNPNVKYSRIAGDYSIFRLNCLGRDVAEDKQAISKFMDSHKDAIAKKYTSYPKSGVTPSWIKRLEQMVDSKLNRP